ncbi:hypothetical protein BJ166DRAFT_510202 [Pestalotiopsis sp. NC0098]|nr:hypothetical protein BJ166DRAFT_510202 [Pestalotiopsis sp. NC0098]
MRWHMEGLVCDDTDIARQLRQAFQAMDEISEVWPCIWEVGDSILHAREKQIASIPQSEMLLHDTFSTFSFLPSTSNDLGTGELF